MGSALVRLVSLAIVAMLVIPPAQMVSAQENVQTTQATPPPGERVSAEALLNVLRRAENWAANTFAVLEARGVSVPDEVMSVYNETLTAASDAAKLIDEGKYAEAKTTILEAMHKLKVAVSAVTGDLENVETESERENYRARGIEVAVQRIQATIERLENIKGNVKAIGIDTSKIEEKLTLVREKLMRIENAIRAENFEALKEINKEFGEAMSELKPAAENVKQRRAEWFLGIVENKVSLASENLSAAIGIESIPPVLERVMRKDVDNKLEEVQRVMAEVRELLKAGELENAMALMNEFKSYVENMDNACMEARGKVMKFKGLAKEFENATGLDFSDFMRVLSEQLGSQFENFAENLARQPVLDFKKLQEAMELRAIQLRAIMQKVKPKVPVK